MTKSVLIIKNMSHEGPGLLQTMLEEKGVTCSIIDLDAGATIPSPKDFDAMIVMGGVDSANDETEKMKTELQRIREAIDLKLPFFGVCLGLQTLVKAAGGQVTKNPVREVAFRDSEGKFFTVDLTEEGKSDPLMQGLNSVVPMFHLHGETVKLTSTMALLASGKWCQNQIVRIAPKMYGIQGHMELTDAMFQEWCEKNDWLAASDQEELRKDWALRKAELEKTIRILFGNFLTISGLIE